MTNELNADFPVAIDVTGISKIFRVYVQQQDRVKELFSPRRRQYHTDVAALTDVSFQVQRGEAVGIIGKNGSGKSTLLQVISGVLSPTAGAVKVNGKIAALLELGAGFNMDYTGLQNIHLFGLVHGFGSHGIESELDNIIAFADIGNFLNQPVRTYSSGMFVRLAFSCAIHIRPDIFIVDEALAVGDLRFTQKCYKFMRDYVENGGTLLFVSHDMGSVRSVTSRVLWIDDGKLRSQGPVRRVTDEYVAYMTYGDPGPESVQHPEVAALTDGAPMPEVPTCQPAAFWSSLRTNWRQPGEESYVLRNGAMLLDYAMEPEADAGRTLGIWQGDEETRFSARFRFEREVDSPVLGVAVYDAKSSVVFHINTAIYGNHIAAIAAGEVVTFSLRFRLPGMARGQYSLYVNVVDGDYDENTSLCMLSGIGEFQVIPPEPLRRLMGCVHLECIELDIERT